VTGFSVTRVGFVVALLGTINAMAMLLNAAHSDRTGERHRHIALPCGLVAAGFVMAALSNRPAIVLMGFAVAMIGHGAINAVVWGLPTEFSLWQVRGSRHRCRQHDRDPWRLPGTVLDGVGR
jgi:MFS transporter, ACS family, tartrate transporter